MLSERVAVLESSTRMQQMTLHGLGKYQNYSVQVVASTRVGSGLKSRSIYCTTKEDGEWEFTFDTFISRQLIL